MADTDMKHVVLVALVVLVVLFGVYQYDHTLMGVLPMLGVEGFEDKKDDKNQSKAKLETLLVGDDLGKCVKYDFTQTDWHYWFYDMNSNVSKH